MVRGRKLVDCEQKSNTFNTDFHNCVADDSPHDQLYQYIHIKHRELLRNAGNNCVGIAVGTLVSSIRVLSLSQVNADRDIC